MVGSQSPFVPKSKLVRNFVEQIIVLWFGSLASIPTGFALCDGTQGTPDLRDKFIIGAGDTYNPNDTGGSSVHTHTFTGDGHTHVVSSPFGVMGGASNSRFLDSSQITGTTDNGVTLPPFKSLAYIMEL